MREFVSLSAATAAIAMASPAFAAIDLVNLPPQSAVPQTLTFTATSASMVVNFQGYNLPSSTTLVNIFLAATGTAPSAADNLLGLHYTYTPSACAGFHATEGTDPTAYGASNLVFGGSCIGLYDSFNQTVSTTVGTEYRLQFGLSVDGRGANGLRVFATEASAVTGAVPEPATWAMMLLGFGGIGIAMRHRDSRRAPKLRTAA